MNDAVRPNRGSCPVCGHDMGEHTIDRSTPNAILNCPAPPLVGYERDADAPLNELGMVKRKRSDSAGRESR